MMRGNPLGNPMGNPWNAERKSVSSMMGAVGFTLGG
jgi:hypothetical protein